MSKKLLFGAAGVLMLVAASVVSALPTSAGEEQAVLTVTKTVEGTAPVDAEFVINVLCTRSTPPLDSPVDQAIQLVYDENISFGAEGGSEDFFFSSEADCVITEIEDGGADSSTGPVEVTIDAPTEFSAEIVNTFNAPTTDTTEAPTTTTAAAAAGAVRAAPTFTG